MNSPAKTIQLVNINEITVFYFIFLGLIGKKPYALAIDPYIPPTAKILSAIVSNLVVSGRALYAHDICPELDHVREVFAEIYLYNVFGKIEAWQNKCFNFSGITEDLSDYAMAYKHLTCNHVRTKYFTILLLSQLSNKYQGANIQLTGLLPLTEEALEAYNGHNRTVSWIKSFRFPWVVINLIIAFLVTIFALGWIVIHTRPFHRRPKSITLAADFIDDARDLILLKEVAKIGQVIIVERSHNPTFTEGAAAKVYPKCGPKTGIFGLFEALEAAGLILRDTGRLFQYFYTCEPAHFFNITALPFRRIVIRALFNKFRPAYFWGRDDYNVEHILRRQELHRFGGLSLGINHGFPSYADLFPQWRYISFDRYYTFGRTVYERIYKKTWAKDMGIVPVGMFGLDRKAYTLMDTAKPTDIVVFCAVFTGNPTLIDIVRNLALAFPDRTIWLQIKTNYRKFKRAEEFISACTQGLENVIYTTESPISLYPKAQYTISDASTTVIEALQFGSFSFMADVCNIHEVCIFREFPGICVKSADAVIRRINDLEAGRWSYPRESYGELVDLSRRPWVDIILEDMRLTTAASSPT
jgi:hypothetical protein